MTCGTCIRFRPVMAGRFGFCRWPGMKPEPYWRAGQPSGDLLVHLTHGADCAAAKARRPS